MAYHPDDLASLPPHGTESPPAEDAGGERPAAPGRIISGDLVALDELPAERRGKFTGPILSGGLSVPTRLDAKAIAKGFNDPIVSRRARWQRTRRVNSDPALQDARKRAEVALAHVYVEPRTALKKMEALLLRGRAAYDVALDVQRNAARFGAWYGAGQAAPGPYLPDVPALTAALDRVAGCRRTAETVATALVASEENAP